VKKDGGSNAIREKNSDNIEFPKLLKPSCCSPNWRCPAIEYPNRTNMKRITKWAKSLKA
jgi:hypothetical protein